MRFPVLFFWLYWGISLGIYLVAVPFLLLLSFKAKYRHSIPARFFLWKNSRHDEYDLWLHACSLGEVKSLQSVIKALGERRILLSVITKTGFDEAKRLYPHAHVVFLPFELFLPFWSPMAKRLVVVEAELWLALFYSAKNMGAKTLLASARISNRSYPRYLKFRWFYKLLFCYVDEVLLQREEDSPRFASLGARNIRVMGNLKLSNQSEPTRKIPKPKSPLFVAASTHEGEERLILEAFKGVDFSYHLAIVPRHPERFEAVWQLISSYDKEGSGNRFSENSGNPWGGKLLLVDKMGELNNFYAIADVVILGGSFFPIGGHNPLEPAHFGCKLLSGTHVHNQLALFDCISGYACIHPKELHEYVRNFKELPQSRINSVLNLDIFFMALDFGSDFKDFYAQGQ